MTSSSKWLPITRGFPATTGAFLGRGPCWAGSRSGRCSSRRPLATPRSPARRRRRASSRRSRAGVAYAVFGTCRPARRRPELDDRDHGRSGARAGRGRVPARGIRRASRGARPADRASCSSLPGCSGSGSSSEFLARPVLVGFISGIGIVIIVGQMPKLLGLTVQPGNVPETLWRTVAALDELGWRDAGRRARVARRAARPAPRRPRRAVGARSSRRSRSRSAAPSTSRRRAWP